MFVGAGLFLLGILADARGLEVVFGIMGLACLASLVAFIWLPATETKAEMGRAVADPADPAH